MSISFGTYLSHVDSLVLLLMEVGGLRYRM